MTRVHATLYGSIRTMASIMIYEKNTLAYVTMLWHVLFQVKHSANHVVEVSESTVGTWYIYNIILYILYMYIIYIYAFVSIPSLLQKLDHVEATFLSLKASTLRCFFSPWNTTQNSAAPKIQGDPGVDHGETHGENWLFNMSPLYGNQSPTDELKGSPATDARFRFTIVH